MILIKNNIFLYIIFFLVVQPAAFAKGVDSSLGQMTRSFSGNFYNDCLRAGVGGQTPAILMNPSLSYSDKFSSSIELYNLNKYSKVENNSNYNSLNFILKERELYKFNDIQFGFHYSNFSVKDIEEYDLTGTFRGKTSDEESLLLINANVPFIIKNEKFRTGINFKYYTHSIASYKAVSFGADAGISFSKNNFSSGLSIKNIFSTKLDYKNYGGKIPVQICAGTGYLFQISKKSNVSIALDYIAKSENTDNCLAYGFDFGYLFTDKFTANFIYGSDNIYISHSIGIKINYDKKLNCGFSYSLNKNPELGDNTAVFLGWNFGVLEIERFEKYSKMEKEGDNFYKSGEWLNALKYWESAYKLYPAKQTRAKVSYDLLKQQVDYRENYNSNLFRTNTENFLKGKENLNAGKLFESIGYFSGIKYNDDPKNMELFEKAGDYIKKISLIILESKSKSGITDDSTVKTTQDKSYNTVTYDTESLKQFISTFIDMDRLELANSYFKLYSKHFSDADSLIIQNKISSKKIEIENKELLKSEFSSISEKIKQAFSENNYISVIELYISAKSKFSNYNFLNFSNLTIYYEQSKIKLQEAELRSSKTEPVKIDYQQIENFYINAAKHYLNYLQTNSKSELIQSIGFYEKILEIDPLHKCRADYEKAKALIKSME
ncbi:hypothetical protein KA977_05585 [Candidatus Dependentiae bacterium]|nr:hypothetical protein [Candidatus Dependentiae bacterium]